MINTNKLLSNRSGGTTILSRKSVINIGLIRDDVKKVDNLLKMKLVMSKVREGIEKENQERLKRKKREDDLESEICNCDDDPDKRDIDPKKPRGLLGSLIGGILGVLGGIALKFLPTLLKVFSFIRKIAKPLTIVLGGAFTIFKTFLTLFKSTSDELRGVDRNLIKKGTIERVFTDFGNAVLIALSGVGIAVASASALNLIFRKRLMAVDVLVDNLILQRRSAKAAKTLTDDELIEQAAKTLGLNLDDVMTQPIDRASVRRRNISRTLEEAKEVIPNRKPRVQYEDFLGMNKPKKGVQVPESPVDLLQRQRQRSARRIKTNLTDKAIQEALDKKRVADILDPEDMFRFPARLEDLTDSTKSILKKFSPNNVNLRKTLNDLANDVDPFDKRKFFSIDPEFGFQLEDPFRKLNTNKVLSNKQILEGTDLLKAPIIKNLKPEQLLKRGGGSILLKQIGGEAFAASFKQGLKSAVGPIPFIGDLIGVLLDYYVFGEPIGRAVLKGVGSFAVAALLGGLGFAIGGPVGAFIGGVAGGIGGDILGGIVYDMFFGKNAAANRRGFAGATKAGVKALTQYGEGGYVGEQTKQPMLNSIDKSTDLRVVASYDKTGVGKVKFVPIFLPKSQKEPPQEEQQFNMTSNTTETRTFAGLYER